MQRAKIIGVTGNIGSGKSIVSKLFEVAGCLVYNSDKEAKNIIQHNAKLKSEIISLLGSESYDKEGNYDTGFVSSKVFVNDELLKSLNHLVHPIVDEHFKLFCNQSSSRLIIKESALLEKNDSGCDYLIFVSTSKKLKVKRTLKRDPTRTEEQVLAILDKQIEDGKGCLSADFVIINDDTESVIEQVEEILEILALE
jgi:dephospho-CoA kinase